MIRTLALLTVTALVPFTASAKAKKPAVPTAEERILKSIDNTCGDTWCEGDFQFTFNSVALDKAANQTIVNFVMSPWLDETPVADEATFTASTLAPEYKVKCVVKGYSDEKVILKELESLNWDFYLALSDCVNSLEKALNK